MDFFHYFKIPMARKTSKLGLFRIGFFQVYRIGHELSNELLSQSEILDSRYSFFPKRARFLRKFAYKCELCEFCVKSNAKQKFIL